MPIKAPRDVGFRTIKKLVDRLAPREREPGDDAPISVEDGDVPDWQRQLVWNDSEMGLLAYSIIRQYPIGLILLWKKPDDGVRVPIDGRQRLTAIRRFYDGRVAIPDLPTVSPEYRGRKYVLLDGDKERGCQRLSQTDRDLFDDYEPIIREYEDIPEDAARDIFAKLQGGKSLTKTEVRAALGGRVAAFVSEMTSPARIADDDEDAEDVEGETSHHPFFKTLAVKNIRKAHRNVCDILLHEFLYPGKDKHWSSLQEMYLDKQTTLSEGDRAQFRKVLGRFQRAVEFREKKETRILPQLRSAFQIVTYFRAWFELAEQYAHPSDFSFQEIVKDFEQKRASHKKSVPWVLFNSSLSNAGYAKQRLDERHDILMTYIFRRYPTITLKDPLRTFSDAQKIAIWERANHRCEWVDGEKRCVQKFPNFRGGDADHVVKWSKGGPTSLENGRLLCPAHNRAPRS